jgi:KTSC domain
MAEIEMQSVISSNIKAIGFDKTTGTMRVTFNSGATYDAPGATQEDFDAFRTAKSHGVHFNKILKKAFAWAKATEKKG